MYNIDFQKKEKYRIYHYVPIKLILLSICFNSVGYSQSSSNTFIPMVEIPSGSFYMGSDGLGMDYDEAPIHKVVFSHPFRMGITEVTNKQYEAFDPEHKKMRGKNGLSVEDDEAVTNVSYHDAIAFCKWLSHKEGKNYRLPTEAEWEYACRAGSYTLFSTGDDLPVIYHRNQKVARDFSYVSLKVAQTPPNAFGLYGMHGNVEEWCLDWYAPYLEKTQTNPSGPSHGEFRVTRGGSHHTPTKYLRSANRLAMIPEDKHSQTGFRIVEASYPLNIYEVDEPKPLNQAFISQQDKVWDSQVLTPFFLPPIPYVIPPACDSKIPFYSHNHQPALTWCDNGDLLCVWFSSNNENGREMVVLGSRLRADRNEWEKASLFFKVPDRNMTGSALYNDGQGTLYHLNGVEASGDWQNLAMILRTSQDNGATWSSPSLIAPEHAKRHQVIAGTIKTREGWLIQACDAGPGSHDGAAIHISKDKGKTWHDPWDGTSLPDFKEGNSGSTIAGIHAGIVQLEDGRLLALGRGNSIRDKEGKDRMPMSISNDMGKSWNYSATSLPPIDGGQRLVLMKLREGPLLLVSFTDHPLRTPIEERGMLFKNKDGKEYIGYGMYAALSYDEGKTWPVRKLITDGVYRFLNGGAWTGFFEMDEFRAEPRGYLAGTQPPDNLIHIVSSRLHYRFNLSWIEQ